MNRKIFKLPALYADHHVIEVRRLLLALPGVAEVCASSAFQQVEIYYDETKLTPEQLRNRLEEAGYLGELPVPIERESGAGGQNGHRLYFRQAAADVPAGQAVRFAQEVPTTGRPLWPCPGLGAIPYPEEETHG